MYVLAPWKKNDPVVRWNLPDRLFFGYGACHILAGVFLDDPASAAFKPYWIVPKKHPGTHIFASDGQIAFDYHGYATHERLMQHHFKVWRSQYSGWDADVHPVEFDLLDESALNQRNMRGPKQYLHDPVPRANNFIKKMDHVAASRKARSLYRQQQRSIAS